MVFEFQISNVVGAGGDSKTQLSIHVKLDSIYSIIYILYDIHILKWIGMN